jgi:hypothetical protein
MSTSRSAWMREFQHRSHTLGGHPTAGIASILYNEGRGPKEAAEAMYGRQTKKAHDCTCKVKVVGKLTHKSKKSAARDPRRVPCECGSKDAHWHGDTFRVYTCNKCWKTHPNNPNSPKGRRRDPAPAHTTTKPLVLKKVGSKWELYLDARAAMYRTLKSSARTWLAKFPMDELVPLVKTGPKSADIVVGGKPAKLSKSDAQHLAHMIGHYKLGIGSFTYTYVEEI